MCFITHGAPRLADSMLHLVKKHIKMLIRHHNLWAWQCINVETGKKMVPVCRSTGFHLVVKATGFTGKRERDETVRQTVPTH